MRVLILGGNGMLGHKLFQVWGDRFEVWTTLRSDSVSGEIPEIFNSTNIVYGINAEEFNTVENAVKKVCPDVIINAIGIVKQVDDSKNVVKTLTLNSVFPHQLADLAQKKGIRLINISTDCVFSGKSGNYREEDSSDATDLYGKSKNLGEVVTVENCLTLRTSIIGRELKTKHSLVEWFLSQAGKKINGYKNAIFSGFPTIVLAEIIGDLMVRHKEMYGLYHVSSNPISKFELLRLLKKAYQIDVEIEPFEKFKIDRSLNSTKFRLETAFQPIKWEEMVKKMVDDPFPYSTFRK